MRETTPNKTILEVKNLSCGYSKTNISILQNIDFTVSKGEMVSILGTNGSGKTTLLKTISSIISPAKGKILLQGEEIKNISLKERSTKTAVVMQFQNAAYMTVEEYILLGRLPYFKKFQFFETQKDIDLVHKYLELTNTMELKDVPFNEISGGEKQLVSIARALVQEPVLLLLDEPTSHLDISHQAQILNLINQMKEQLGIAVLIVLHDINLASEYSDTLILINKGTRTIQAKGKPEDVITEKLIKKVYNTDVYIKENPISSKPCVFLSKKENIVPMNQ
ncbi:MAG: ABC transporter ATP-binding protein [Desulfobacteraceae bacterium]|nr:ABC transporter ATP-binding protein [Desulfobacteraceae bacterium]